MAITKEQFKDLQIEDQLLDCRRRVWEVISLFPTRGLVVLVGKSVALEEVVILLYVTGKIKGLSDEENSDELFGQEASVIPTPHSLLVKRLVEAGKLSEAEASALESAAKREANVDVCCH